MPSKSLDIARRFHERMATASGTRADLRVTDYRGLRDEGSFKIALSYDKNLSTPKPAEIRQFITAKFNNTLVPNMATARNFTEGRHYGITLVATSRKRTMKMTDAKKAGFKEIIAGTTFLDTQLEENWKVRTGSNGRQYLECANQEDVAGLLKSAVTASTRMDIGLRLGSEAVGGATLPEKDDVVKFFADNAQRVGTVTRVKGDDVYIAEEDGNTFIVPNSAVIDIVKKNPKSAQTELNEQAAFYATFLPKDFVQEMFPGAKI